MNPHQPVETPAMPTGFLLAFGVLLLVGVLLSERARRTALSIDVMFLVAGFVIGGGALGWLRIGLDDPLTARFAEIALFIVLFVDGTQLSLRDLAEAWHLPGRALLFGLPITILGIALAGHFILGMTWTEAWLVGAILSPTDPVLVGAILERQAVPLRLRRLLSVESGLNDGIALPVVLLLLAIAGRQSVEPGRPILGVLSGIALGFVLPALFLWAERRQGLASTDDYRPLGGIALATTVFALCVATGANELLAAFTAGITLATLGPHFTRSVRAVGLPAATVMKFATLMIFGAGLTLPFLLATGIAGALFAMIALVAVRPLALVLSFLGLGGLSRMEWLAAAWFGPKGFSSLLYALLMLHAGLERGTWLFQAIALVIVASIIAHSSSDVPVAKAFQQARGV